MTDANCDLQLPRASTLETMLRRGALHFVVVCALVMPSAAAAQEAAQPDPDSPAGVEYQLPLERARDKASGPKGPGGGEPKRGASEADPPPLFGEGIAPEAGSSSGEQGSDSADDGSPSGVGPGDGGRAADGAGAKGDRADSGRADSVASEAGAGKADGQRSLAQSSTGLGSDLAIPGIALGVLLMGGLLGLAMRRGLG